MFLVASIHGANTAIISIISEGQSRTRPPTIRWQDYAAEVSKEMFRPFFREQKGKKNTKDCKSPIARVFFPETALKFQFEPWLWGDPAATGGEGAI